MKYTPAVLLALATAIIAVSGASIPTADLDTIYARDGATLRGASGYASTTFLHGASGSGAGSSPSSSPAGTPYAHEGVKVVKH